MQHAPNAVPDEYGSNTYDNMKKRIVVRNGTDNSYHAERHDWVEYMVG